MNLYPKVILLLFLNVISLIIRAQVQLGQDLDGEYENDLFGTSVSISHDGSIIAIGSEYNSDHGEKSGHVRVYKWKNPIWVQLGFDLDGEGSLDLSGGAISLSDDGFTLAIGAKNNDGNGLNSGHVRVYHWNSSTWIQKGEDIDGTNEGDESGSSVSLSADGNLLAIGALSNNENGVNSGQLRVFEWKDTAWVQKGQSIYGESEEEIAGVVSLSKEGSTVAIGAPLNMEADFRAGQVRVFQWDSKQ